MTAFIENRISLQIKMEFESCSWQGVLVQHYVINLFIFAADQWISPGTPVSSTNKTDYHDITEILLKVALKHHKSIKSNPGN
jgi:hypothetical protein